MLENGSASRRLEHRAAAVLELLSRQPGRVVSQAEIIDQVWDGRAVSANSVAVVISDLRRALDDDPKAPRIVETLPKRGYRIIADVTPDQTPAPAVTPALPVSPQSGHARPFWTRRTTALAALLAFGLILALAWTRFSTAPDRLRVTINPTVNETGDEAYAALTRSVTELLTLELTGQPAFTVATGGETDLIVHSKLILWDGHPSMSITAQRTGSEDVLWSGMASGPETLPPRQVGEEIADLAAQVEGDGASSERPH